MSQVKTTRFRQTPIHAAYYCAAHLRDGERWAPLLFQNVQANAALAVDVGVVHLQATQQGVLLLSATVGFPWARRVCLFYCTACASPCSLTTVPVKLVHSTPACNHRRVQPQCAAAHLRLELNLRRLKGVVWREVDIDKKHAACIRAVARAHYGRLRAREQLTAVVIPGALVAAKLQGQRASTPSDLEAKGRMELRFQTTKHQYTKPKASRTHLPVEKVVTGRAGTARRWRILLQVLRPRQRQLGASAEQEQPFQLTGTQLCRNSGQHCPHTCQKSTCRDQGAGVWNITARFVAPSNHVSNMPGQTCSSFDMRLDAICAASWPEASSSLANRS